MITALNVYWAKELKSRVSTTDQFDRRHSGYRFIGMNARHTHLMELAGMVLPLLATPNNVVPKLCG